MVDATPPEKETPRQTAASLLGGIAAVLRGIAEIIKAIGGL
jgi:hypothetical protein